MHRNHAPGWHRYGLALGVHRPPGLADHGVPYQPPGRLPEQHVARFSSRLEPCCGVHHVAQERLVSRADDHLAGRYPVRHSNCTSHSAPSDWFNLARRERMSVAARTARSASSSCRRGIAEHGQNRVTDELVHPAAVPLHGRAHLLEQPPITRRSTSGVELARRVGSSRPRRRTPPSRIFRASATTRLRRRAAIDRLHTETEAVRVFPTTDRADRHLLERRCRRCGAMRRRSSTTRFTDWAIDT